MKPYDYLIVGSGLFGAMFAHEAHKAGKRCLVIEKRPHTGGNIYCVSTCINTVRISFIQTTGKYGIM